MNAVTPEEAEGGNAVASAETHWLYLETINTRLTADGHSLDRKSVV